MSCLLLLLWHLFPGSVGNCWQCRDTPSRSGLRTSFLWLADRQSGAVNCLSWHSLTSASSLPASFL